MPVSTNAPKRISASGLDHAGRLSSQAGTYHTAGISGALLRHRRGGLWEAFPGPVAIVVYELLDADTIYPITAYAVPEP